MDDGLKQRLIGAIVLLALAVIFVPVIFDREQLQPLDRRSQIPLAPEVLPVVVAEPSVPEDVEPAPEVEDMFLPEESSAEAGFEEDTEQPEPKLDAEGVPDAWVLQVASYKNSERAEEMQQLLAAEGYTAYTRNVTAAQGEMTRLFVGPKLDKAKLLQEQAAIEEKFKVSTFVFKFKP